VATVSVPGSDDDRRAGTERSGTGQYFTARPDTRSRPTDVALVLPDLSLRLRTDRGVFSADRIDPGTKLLLLELPSPDRWPEGPALDLGCGYGPIACTLAARDPTREVWAVDVNERARELCATNAQAAGVGDRLRVASPADVPAPLRFGLIVSNPPIRIGKAPLRDLLGTWLGRLTEDGEAWLVVHRHLGSDSLASWMTAQGWTVARVRSRQGYRILRVTGPASTVGA
jgi:16S rRNA G1207 methylase RsmC